MISRYPGRLVMAVMALSLLLVGPLPARAEGETPPEAAPSAGAAVLSEADAFEHILTLLHLKDDARAFIASFRNSARRSQDWEKIFSDGSGSSDTSLQSLTDKAVKELFEPERFYNDVHDRIVQNGLSIDPAPILQKLQSPVLQKEIAANNRFVDDPAKGEEEFQIFLVRLQNNPPDKDRLDLMRRYEAVNRMAEFVADVQVSLAFEIAKGYVSTLPAADPRRKQWKDERYKTGLLQMRAALYEPLVRQQSLYALFLFQDLSAAEMEELIAFYSAPEAEWLNKTIAKAFLDSFKGLFRSLGKRIGEMEKEQTTAPSPVS